MYYDLVKKISELNHFQDIQKGLSTLDESKNKLFVSPLYGVVKALLVKKKRAFILNFRIKYTK